MTKKSSDRRTTRRKLPILARHAVSLSMVFVVGLLLSYLVGQQIHAGLQMDKLASDDDPTFQEGVAYVAAKAADDREGVLQDALRRIDELDDTQRAADVLLAVVVSHSNRTDIDLPIEVYESLGPLMERMPTDDAVGLYDALSQAEGVDAVRSARALLDALDPADDAELLRVVDLLEARLLWSRDWAPDRLWIGWLSVLADAKAELTQFNAAKRLGDLPDALGDPRIRAALGKLAQSEHDTVRNRVLEVVAGYAAIAEDPTAYEQIIFRLGQDPNPAIARRAWLVVGHLEPFSGFAVNWKDADPFVAEAMLWAAVKANPENPKPAMDALKTKGYEAGGALALDAWRRPVGVVTDADNLLQELIRAEQGVSKEVKLRSILASKDYMNGEASIIDPYGYKSPADDETAHLYFAAHSVTAAFAPAFDLEKPFSGTLLTAYLEGLFDHPFFVRDTIRMINPREEWPVFARLLAAMHGLKSVDLERLIGELPFDQPALLDLFTLALAQAEDDTIDRFIRSSHPRKVSMAAVAAAMKGYRPTLIEGITASFLRENPDLTIEAIRALPMDELSALGLTRIDALPALLDAAEAAPPSANRAAQAKLLRLALWMRGDLGDDFTPTAEAMLFDRDLPTSTVLMALLHKRRPVALAYLFGDRVTPRPDLHALLIQQRYWHVFRRFVDASDLTLWLWGDPAAQAFQLEAMRQWYAVHRWTIERGDWPVPKQ